MNPKVDIWTAHSDDPARPHLTFIHVQAPNGERIYTAQLPHFDNCPLEPGLLHAALRAASDAVAAFKASP